MPLGNGTLGAAVWAANGFIARLNRIDTFPDRKSTGQVTGQTFGTLAGVTAGGRSVVASTPDASTAQVNGKYVTAGSSPLIAAATTIGPWEEFDPITSGAVWSRSLAITGERGV